jgi:hypothetical protein
LRRRRQGVARPAGANQPPAAEYITLPAGPHRRAAAVDALRGSLDSLVLKTLSLATMHWGISQRGSRSGGEFAMNQGRRRLAREVENWNRFAAALTPC